MKLAIFHLAAYVVVGVVLAEEKEKPEGFNPMYWLDDRMTEMFNPTALAKPGDECTVAIVRRSLLRISLPNLDILDWSYPRSSAFSSHLHWRGPAGRGLL